MDENTVPDLVDGMTERVQEIVQTRVELLEEREQATLASNQLQMLRTRCNDFDMSALILFVKTRTTDIESALTDLEDELESIESDFEELSDQFRQEQRDHKSDFDESCVELTRELRNAKSIA